MRRHVQSILRQVTEKLKTGRLARALALARVGARTGAALATSVGSDAAAAQALQVLGSLRGMAAKVGQTLSYVDGVIPEKHRTVYEAALRNLQRAVPASPPEAVRALVEQELGARIEDLFVEWSAAPVASASIGQVHRARLQDGRVCAVKVQHTHIQEAFESDLTNVSSLTQLVGWALPSGLDPAPLLKEVTARFREELDYTREARQSEAFRAFWRHEPQVLVPAVVASHSSARVLTTEWVAGATLEEAALLPEAERRAYAERLWTFVFRSLLVGGAFNADPHPGNYFFQERGIIAFLDFGCVQLMPEGARRAALLAHQAAVERDWASFHSGMAALMESRPGAFEDAMVAYVGLCFKPIFDAPFRITRQWVAETTRAGQATKKAVLARGSNASLPPAHLAMMNRLQFGFYSVVARLDVEVDYRVLHARILDEAKAVPIAPIADVLNS